MTIPSEVRDALGIDTPDRIFIVLEGNQARIEHDALTVDTIMGSFPRRADQPYLGSREEVDEAMEEAAEALGPRREPS
jgi:bifunctional DNA-binding transcriptional regulator/antitoxin component of YhaV-PrlF toxin-antitoxin module